MFIIALHFVDIVQGETIETTVAGLEEKARKIAYLSELVGQSATSPLAGRSQEPTLAHDGELGVTFIGHSSFLLQIGGKKVLVDPVFAKWLIVLRRLRVPGVRIPDLPAIDAVLLSHAHMDHLNRPSLRRIVRRTRLLTGNAPIAIVPWGVENLIQDLGFAQVVSLEWWQSTLLGPVEITLTPSKHWGARLFSDTYRGYGGYVLRGGGHSVYHSGDTAYFGGFAEIGRRLAPEVALLPIGAYSPDNFRSVHTSPEDALRGFLDLRARFMVPMHFGTFRLSAEPVDEPLPRLMAAARGSGVEECVCALAEGETRIFRTPAKQSACAPVLTAAN
jgi:L-ascorbate metabolism protein UlaG (beta-lactamase superfamily)